MRKEDVLNIAIKPCPFCGGEAELRKIPGCDIDPYYVRCKLTNYCSCYAATCSRQTAEEAIKIWNKRAED